MRRPSIKSTWHKNIWIFLYILFQDYGPKFLFVYILYPPLWTTYPPLWRHFLPFCSLQCVAWHSQTYQGRYEIFQARYSSTPFVYFFQFSDNQWQNIMRIQKICIESPLPPLYNVMKSWTKLISVFFTFPQYC